MLPGGIHVHQERRGPEQAEVQQRLSREDLNGNNVPTAIEDILNEKGFEQSYDGLPG